MRYKNEAEWRAALVRNGVATPEQIEKQLGVRPKPTGPNLYRKKPVVVSALEWTGNLTEMLEFCPEAKSVGVLEPELRIETLEGTMVGSLGDFIIKGVSGEFYPCKPDIFWKSYERV